MKEVLAFVLIKTILWQNKYLPLISKYKGTVVVDEMAFSYCKSLIISLFQVNVKARLRTPKKP